MNAKSLSLVLLSSVVSFSPASSVPMGTAFDYRGKLNTSGVPANGLHDFRIGLYDAESEGNRVGLVNELNGVPVVNGLFNARLNFGPLEGTFSGAARWLQIEVRTSGGLPPPDFTVLSPRQPAPLTPYALYAVKAGNIEPWDMTVGSVTDDQGQVHSDLLMFSTGSGWKVALSPDGGLHGANYNLDPSGFASFGGALEVGGSGDFGGDLRSSANAGIGGNLQVNGGGNVAGTLHAGDLNVDALGTFGSLRSNENIDSGGNLTVTGTANLNAGADVTGDMNVGGAFTVDTDQSIALRTQGASVAVKEDQVALEVGGGNLIMQAASGLAGGCNFTLDTAPASAPPHTIEIGQDGNVFLGKSLNVRLDSQFNGSVQVSSNLTVNGVFTVFGNSSMGDIFSHDITSQNDLHAQGGVLAGYASFTGDVTARAYNTTSDRAAKENIEPVDPRAILDKVAGLPISVWNFKSDGNTRHIGPMAQDVHEAFNVGSDERHIATVDADGLALAAIQGLNQVVREKDGRIRALERDVAELKARMNELTETRKAASP